MGYKYDYSRRQAAVRMFMSALQHSSGQYSHIDMMCFTLFCKGKVQFLALALNICQALHVKQIGGYTYSMYILLPLLFLIWLFFFLLCAALS